MKELRPSGYTLQSFQVGVPLPRLSWFSTVFLALSNLSRILLLEKGWTFQANFLHSSISACTLAQFSSDMSSRGSFASVSSSHHLAQRMSSHHDLFRGSQASIVCFDDCSVDSPEVSLLLVLKLVGAEIISLPLRPVASDKPSRSVNPMHPSPPPRVSGSGVPLLSAALCKVSSLPRLRSVHHLSLHVSSPFRMRNQF